MISPSPLVYFVGAGPGAVDLITERGATLLKQADLVMFAGSLVNPEHIKRCSPSCECWDSSTLSLEEQIQHMSRVAKTGGLVVRLHTGDPCLYGAIAEQIEALQQENIQPVVIPGVSSVFAAAAALQTELTYPGVSQSLILTRTPGRTPMPEGESAYAFAKTGATLAFYLSMGQVEPLVQELLRGGLSSETPVAIVYRASWPDEKILQGTINTLVELTQTSGIGRQAIILIGKALKARGNRSLLYHQHFSHGYRNTLLEETFHGKCALYAYTEKGFSKAKEIAHALNAHIFTSRGKLTEKEIKEGNITLVPSTEQPYLVEQQWGEYQAHIFIGAVGIAVRKIAPHIEHKNTDPAVISCTESGSHIISLLSGHLGGANRLCRRIARITGGQAIISTATDQAELLAFDEAAARTHASIQNPEKIKDINAALLHGEPIFIHAPHSIAHLWDTYPQVRSGSLNAYKKGEEYLVIWLGAEEALPQDLPQEALLIRSSRIILGIGCKRDTDIDTLEKTATLFLERENISWDQISGISSCDIKANEPALLALTHKYNLPFYTYPTEELCAIKTPTPSDNVMKKIGTPSVAEASAIVASGGHIFVPKTKGEGITLALAEKKYVPVTTGKITVVGLGSCSPEHITPEVSKTLLSCDIIAGYTKYLDFIRTRIMGKPLIQSGMMGEVERCRKTLEAATQGKHVCMVCSGDPGVLAMAGLLYELREHNNDFKQLEIKVLPGITAASVAAASLGAPLQNGYCLISLSNLLISTEEVKNNIEHASKSMLPIALYNPAGRKRRALLEWTIEHLTQIRGPEIYCAVVKHAGRTQEEKWIGTLQEFPEDFVDMSSLIIIGGPRTKRSGKNLFEARGYEEKYTLPPQA